MLQQEVAFKLVCQQREVSEPRRAAVCGCLHSQCIFNCFQETARYADYIICDGFVSFDACASSAYVKGLDDIEW